MNPALEWITDSDTPNADHLYRDGQWFGSVGKDQMPGQWFVCVVKNGEPVIKGHCKSISTAKMKLERMAKQ